MRPVTPATFLGDRLIGIVLLCITLLVVAAEWTGSPLPRHLAAAGFVVFITAAVPRVGWSRVVFVVVGAALFADAVSTRADWLAITVSALNSATFIAAFFTALTLLASASASSPAIAECGRFLAEQPPGRRYAALTVGGHLFALILNYGSVALLGRLAEISARREPNIEIRTHRIRRMLLAIQRGFVSTVAWSPLTFSMAISTSLVPGATWAGAAGYCAVSSLIIAGAGWALDTIFKPRLSVPAPPRAKAEGTWASLLPLLALLAVLIVAVVLLHEISGVRAVGVVMVVVPAISVGWIALQNLHDRPALRTRSRIAHYLFRDLPNSRSELVLLTMAGFIGTFGAKILVPLVAASGIDLAAVPGWTILVALVWLIPLAGQVGMNPILAVSLVAPVLPAPSAMGVGPAAIITALTAGWALSSGSSPFTATTMLMGNMAGVSAWRAGAVWNGTFTVVCAVALSAWVILMTHL